MASAKTAIKARCKHCYSPNKERCACRKRCKRPCEKCLSTCGCRFRNRKMDYFDWAKQFKPILDKDGDARKFETYGADLVEILKVAKTEPERVWTYVDGDRGKPGITEGYHLVNRIYYHVTEVPAEPFTFYWVD